MLKRKQKKHKIGSKHFIYVENFCVVRLEIFGNSVAWVDPHLGKQGLVR